MRDLGRVGVFGSGGAFSRVDQVGFLKAMEEYGIIPFCMTAVSVAALNFAGFIQYGSKGLELVWRGSDSNPPGKNPSIEERGPRFIFDVRNFRTLGRILAKKEDILSNKGIIELTQKLDVNKIVESSVRLNIVVFNHGTREPEIFSNHDQIVRANPEILRQVILASISLDGIFPPVPIQKELGAPPVLYSDAVGYGLKHLFDMGCDTVFVFRSRSPRHESPRSWWLPKILDLHDRPSNILFDEIISMLGERVIEVRLEKGVTTLIRVHFKKGNFGQTIDLAYEKGIKILSAL